MNLDVVQELLKQTLFTSFLLAGPILILTLIVGVIVSIFQTVTSIQEMTLSFMPKVLIVSFALILGGPWMLNQITMFTIGLFQRLPDLAK
jgi:flagellar biosynthesis protein FliQ